jgi:predicted transcriptional regulator
LALALSFSFVAVGLAQSSLSPVPLMQDAHVTNRLVFSAPILLGTGLHDNSALNQTTRIDIYSYVKNNPGVHFRGICQGLALSVGVVQYHLGVLVHAGVLSVYTDGQYKRYFASGSFDEKDKNLVLLLRHDQSRRILTILSQDGPILHKDLARKLAVSSQALSWQMNKLTSLHLVDAVKDGMSKKYVLNEEKTSSISLLFGLFNEKE